MNTDLHAELVAAYADRASARGALAFIRGVLETCQRFKQPLTPTLVAHMLKAANDVLEPPGSAEPVTTEGVTP